MNNNSEIIFSLCSHLLQDSDFKPYEPAEWSMLAEKLVLAGFEPSNLPCFSESELRDVLNLNTYEIQRIKHLLERGGSLAFEIKELENKGIKIVTRADNNYPKILKNRLKKSCPPLFYYAGDLSLLNRNTIGFVGSRNIDEEDVHFTENIVSKVNKLGYGVVSGGAKGVDTVSAKQSLINGNIVIEYIADSLIKKIKSKSNIIAIQNKQLVLLSVVKPDMGFTAATAMMRNKYIYAQSKAAVVVKSDYKKGGTWSGATDCIKHKICPVFCNNLADSRGNQELINLGAIPIDKNWNCDFEIDKATKPQEPVQLSLFE
jgi:predicted Rossmann fold nucleotide-binding protein DprA/Smf involved in DNA uptake